MTSSTALLQLSTVKSAPRAVGHSCSSSAAASPIEQGDLNEEESIVYWRRVRSTIGRTRKEDIELA